MKIENLSLTVKLLLDDFLDQFLVLLSNIGLNRPTVNGGFGQIRKRTYTEKRHLPCPWNRSRRQSQTVDIFRFFFDFFLVRNTELLFLIDNQKAEVMKDNRIRKQGMGSDDKIYLSVLQSFFDVFLFLGRSKAVK